MRDRSLIYSGLLAFLGIITLPFTYNLASGKTAKIPDLRLPAQEKQCVAPVEYMKSSHMQLLRDWRESSVREGILTFTAYDGRSYRIGLTETCLSQCHISKAEFCDRCHSFAGVQGPYCMDCHIDPKQAQKGAR
jgi:hypothetical protein